MINEKEGEILNKGTTAGIAREYFNVHLRKERDRIITELSNYYIAKDLQFEVICGKLGELTMINNSLKLFERDIKNAQKIEGRVYAE